MTRLNKFSLILLLVLTKVEASAQVKTDSITAESIINRSIENCGGERLLDSVSSVELEYKIATAEDDTLSVAIKRSGFYKCYISTMGANYESTTEIYNHDKAVIIKNENVKKITDPVALEALLLQCFISVDYGYKKLGYKFKRLPDHKFDNYDCYVISAISPLGTELHIVYDKETGNLKAVIYPNGNGSVFTDFYKTNGITIPSVVFAHVGEQKPMRYVLQSISYQSVLDTNWFVIPSEGAYRSPDIFKTGIFRYVGSNPGVKIIRTNDTDIEEDDNGKLEFKIKWDNNNEYSLYGIKDSSYYKTRITMWKGNRYYCHSLSSNNKSSTCIIEKVNQKLVPK